ncbi:hypothetical protein SAMN04487775_101147 [Treponema bryantii]|uniref:Phosphatidylglycerol lysyltransferase C-terminal domain-containing protein n=1 Tax=Treponema bryantii TaxID=163 RepID=A0A1I3HXK9_9SPIR|nr:phosphatidylglycerol lysyltransferase domain-containing protein [Treponema bryantii]SFI40320.1 hypothetical protein SAMN04487775_101147 [Treponema bryantii]
MNFQDFEYLNSNLDTSKLFGSDTSVANLFLLQEKYNTELKIHKDILFRYYYGDENRTGYGFPIPMKNLTNAENSPDNWLKTALEHIFDDARQQNRPAAFCLLTSDQKTLINETLARHFPNRTINWKTNRDDCDYIYLREKLADLPGSQYQKKRNHISRFNRTYGTNWEFKSFPENDIAQDILKVSQSWYEENQGESKEVLRLEHESIEQALQNRELLNLRGGVLYINSEPAAMTLASPISPDVLDVIYEKTFGEYEKNGAYAVINQQFSKRCEGFLYLNREEDMGVEGLRKAKLSYKPEMILEKFYGKVK